jgi:Fanconi anemia group M protein
MEYISHPLIKANTVQAREYQMSLIKPITEKNSLVVLSTGLGKTLVSILASAEV